MLDEAVQAPAEPGERHHPVRLFIGSGMPRGLWRRVERRFRPARVVEFYASTEAGAILVNLRDSKLGSMGRPLPGSAEVRIAQYDLDARGLVLDRDGSARGCDVDEVGMLLARVSPTESLTIDPAALAVRPRRRLGRHRRSVPPRRGRRLLASGRRGRRNPDGGRVGVLDGDPGRALGHRRRGPRAGLWREAGGVGSTRSRWPR